MTANRVHFKPNVPQTLSLLTGEGEMDDNNQVQYPLADGRTLVVSHETAAKINRLELGAGQSFGICKDWSGERSDTPRFRVWATAATEQEKAAAEAPSDLEQQLGASLALVRGEGPRSVPPRKPVAPETNTGPPTKGTGTYGAAPLPAPRAKATTRPPSGFPYDVALRHILRTVVGTLDSEHEQWNDAAKQDLVSTVMIAAAKAGHISFDFATEPRP
jgi:hypothetical protein